MHKIRIPDHIATLIKSLHPDLKRKTRAALRIVSTNRHEGEALRDDLEGLKGYRIGRFRIIYRVSAKKVIEVVAIGPRKNIYEETLRILNKDAKKNLKDKS